MQTEVVAFLLREPGASLAPDLQEKVLDAIAAMSPDIRGPDFWAFKGASTYWTYSLLGLLCMLEGFGIAHYAKNEQQVPCTEFLMGMGFTQYDILALGEIDSHSYDMEVVAIRAERYMETGNRMEMVDDLTEYDADQRVLRR